MRLKVLSVFQLSKQEDERDHPPVTPVKSKVALKIKLDGTETFTELVEKRQAICLAPCEFLGSGHLLPFTMEYHKCTVCGCTIKGKTMIRHATCPKGYW